MNLKKMIKELPFVLAGNLVLAIAVSMFIIPFQILSGGVAGIAVALQPLIPVSPTIIVNTMIVGMFLLGFVCLGKEFALKTVVSSLVYPIFLSLITPFVVSIELDPILASLYGGAIAGVGIGLILRTGASSGGMDIPPIIINKFTGVKIATLVLITDTLTVMLGLFTHGLAPVLNGFLSVFATSFAIDRVLSMGGGSAKAVQIISDQFQLLNQRIHAELDRGTTLTQGQGGYTQEAKVIILVVVEKKEYPKLLALVNEVDKEAFMITSDATEVHGSGFSFNFRV